jgi:hypothetical protein
MQTVAALLHARNSQINKLHKFLLHGFHIAQPAHAGESGTNHAHITGKPLIMNFQEAIPIYENCMD